jgi:hypothetical protein
MLTIPFGIYHPLKYANSSYYFKHGNLAFRPQKEKALMRRLNMLEEIASSAAKILILIFWITLVLTIIWGALWLKAHKKG